MRPFWASPAVFGSLLALAGFLAVDRYRQRAAAPPPRPPRRNLNQTPAPLDAYSAMLERAAQVADEGDAERAFAIYALFLADRSEDPRAPEVRFRAARALEDLERFDEAILAYEDLLARHPLVAVARAARRRLAMIHETRRDFDAAIATLAPLGSGVDLEDKASIDLQRARIAERRGDFDQALSLYGSCAAAGVSAETTARATLGQGRVLLLREDSGARRWLEEALRLSGENTAIGREARMLLNKLDAQANPPPEDAAQP